MSVRGEWNAYDHCSLILEWDPRDGIYVVTVPELPGCQTHGETREEAVRQGQDALESWVDAMRHWGHPSPLARHFASSLVDAPGEEATARGGT